MLRVWEGREGVSGCGEHTSVASVSVKVPPPHLFFSFLPMSFVSFASANDVIYHAYGCVYLVFVNTIWSDSMDGGLDSAGADFIVYFCFVYSRKCVNAS